MGARVIACASSDRQARLRAPARRRRDRELRSRGFARGLAADCAGRRRCRLRIRSAAPMRKRACGDRVAGALLVVGFAAGEIPEAAAQPGVAQGLRRARRVLGRMDRAPPDSHRANMTQLLAGCAEGKLSSHVHAVYPLAQSAAALKDIAARKVMGKVFCALKHPALAKRAQAVSLWRPVPCRRRGREIIGWLGFDPSRPGRWGPGLRPALGAGLAPH